MARTPERKTIKQYEEEKARRNAKQKEYRQNHPDLIDAWKQKSYANFLMQRGWQCTPPPGFQPSARARKQKIMQELDSPPADLSDFDFDISEDELPFP